ncbi:proline-rich protein 36-like [Triticum aestivum]|uniref:proline-rich protein 36-like n=1 Tax=Triticum aestivum TaxID=4565 RepID=UPI001D002D03|nr:proline-rich protein 36-like [Triticum aestivum]
MILARRRFIVLPDGRFSAAAGFMLLGGRVKELLDSLLHVAMLVALAAIRNSSMKRGLFQLFLANTTFCRRACPWFHTFPYLPAASLLEISASLPRIWRCQPAAATWHHPIGQPSPQKPPSPTPRSPPVPRAPPQHRRARPARDGAAAAREGLSAPRLPLPIWIEGRSPSTPSPRRPSASSSASPSPSSCQSSKPPPGQRLASFLLLPPCLTSLSARPCREPPPPVELAADAAFIESGRDPPGPVALGRICPFPLPLGHLLAFLPLRHADSPLPWPPPFCVLVQAHEEEDDRASIPRGPPQRFRPSSTAAQICRLAKPLLQPGRSPWFR